MSVEIVPEPPAAAREAILTALADLGGEAPCGWAAVAVAEAVESDEHEP